MRRRSDRGVAENLGMQIDKGGGGWAPKDLSSTWAFFPKLSTHTPKLQIQMTPFTMNADWTFHSKQSNSSSCDIFFRLPKSNGYGKWKFPNMNTFCIRRLKYQQSLWTEIKKELPLITQKTMLLGHFLLLQILGLRTANSSKKISILWVVYLILSEIIDYCWLLGLSLPHIILLTV